jgi:hypothetical protein
MHPQPPGDDRRLLLQPGTAWAACLPAGTRIVVVEGSARLEGPAVWLAETMHMPCPQLRTGDDWTLESAGWVRVRATGACTPILICVAPAPGALAGWLARRWAALGRRMAPRQAVSAGADAPPGSPGC